jgi:hypothetical protein
MEFIPPGWGARNLLDRRRFPLVMVGIVVVLAVAVAVLSRRRAVREAMEKEEARRQVGWDTEHREEVRRWHSELKRRASQRGKGGR